MSSLLRPFPRVLYRLGTGRTGRTFPSRWLGSRSLQQSFSTTFFHPKDEEQVPCLSKDSITLDPEGSSLTLTFTLDGKEKHTVFHGAWLWSNDPGHVHATSGQRTRSPSSYYGWKIKDASILSIGFLQESTITNKIPIPGPAPPTGCMHPIGTVYQLEANLDSPRHSQRIVSITWESRYERLQAQSYFAMDWLVSCRYDDEALNERENRTRVDKAIAVGQHRALFEIDHADLASPNTQDETCFQLLHGIVQHGAVLVRNAMVFDESTVASIGRCLAGSLSHGSLYGDIFHVETMPNAHNIAYTSSALSPHQDLAYYESQPGLQLLHCVCNKGINGGESTLIDAMAAATEFQCIAPHLFDQLVLYEATFVKQRHNADMLYRGPYIQVDSTKSVVGVRWSPPFEGPVFAPSHKMEELLLARAAFERMLDCSLPSELFLSPALDPSLEETLVEYAHAYTWEQKLKPGDVLIFNNQRMLHGRRAFDMTHETASRRLNGCYTNMEETMSHYRMLRRQFGLPHHDNKKVYQRNVGNGSSGVQ